MHTRSIPSRIVIATAVTLLLTPGLPLLAAQTNVTVGAGATTNAHPKAEASLVVQSPFVEPPVPESVFDMPKSKADGKDPFFPKSDRPYGIVTPTKTGPAPVVAELVLRGISGTDDNPLAVINNTNFGVGEELDVTTKAGKLRIRCLEINKAAGTVLVQIGGERRELRLPPLK